MQKGFILDPRFCGPVREGTEPPAHDELQQLEELHSPEQLMDANIQVSSWFLMLRNINLLIIHSFMLSVGGINVR